MPTPVKMPQLGETVFEGTVARWLKRPGDAVERQEPLLDITTDKIDTEVPAPAAGVLLEVLAEEGATVEVGAVIAYIGDEGESTEETAPRREVGEAEALAAASSHPRDARTIEESAPIEKPAGRAFVSPVVARISAENNVNLSEVKGTGRQGRVTRKDLLAFIDARKRQLPAPAARTDTALGEDERLQPHSTMRKAIAEHMVRSVLTSPHVVTVHEADMTAVVRHRADYKESFAQQEISLTFTPYFIVAVASALRRHPTVNSRWTDDGLALSRHIHVGVAVALPDGLVVPVIRDADERSLQELARAVNDLADRARRGDLKPDELRGGTFTLTNHGVSGSLLGTPIINQPQAAILGIGNITKRAVVRSGPAADPLLPSADDTISIRPMCYLSLAFDHRILDGVSADRFLVDVVRRLEEFDAPPLEEGGA